MSAGTCVRCGFDCAGLTCPAIFEDRIEGASDTVGSGIITDLGERQSDVEEVLVERLQKRLHAEHPSIPWGILESLREDGMRAVVLWKSDEYVEELRMEPAEIREHMEQFIGARVSWLVAPAAYGFERLARRKAALAEGGEGAGS